MKRIILLSCYINVVFASSFIDLGKAGNIYGYKQYTSYVKKTNHCITTRSENPRIIITSFGAWEKRKNNLSSTLLNEFASEELTLTDDSFFGETLNKTITIKNKSIDVCFIKLAVAWDISSAILIHETERFQPELVIMMGDGLKGKLMIETKARNLTAMLTGFNYKGNELGALNTPKGFSSITGKFRASRYMNMNWNYKKLKKSLLSIIEDHPAPFEIQLNKRHMKSNSFICNALSYTFLQAINNNNISLFKKKLKIYPTFKKRIVTGFLHLPDLEEEERTVENLELLNQMLTSVIDVNL